MSVLTKDQILKADDLKVEKLTVPEWGGDIFIKVMSGAERDGFEAGCFVGRGKDRRENFQNLRARLVAICIVDEEGKRMFNDAEAMLLGQKSAPAIDRIFTKCQEFNGLTQKDVEELTKNSDSDPSGGSPSA